LWPRKSHPLRDSHPKRPGTATSCGPESAIHEGISTEKKGRQVDFEKVNARGVASRFFSSIKCRKVFCENVVARKGQRARAKNRRKSWLKQLKVVISTGASLPDGSSPQNSKPNFVDLRDDG
jgi:hypothetical protein